MLLSSVVAWLLAAIAPTASPDTVSVLRSGNFIAGGTAHVLALGIFVLLASRIPGMFGRLLCMAWTISAAVSLTRRLAKGTRS